MRRQRHRRGVFLGAILTSERPIDAVFSPHVIPQRGRVHEAVFAARVAFQRRRRRARFPMMFPVVPTLQFFLAHGTDDGAIGIKAFMRPLYALMLFFDVILQRAFIRRFKVANIAFKMVAFSVAVFVEFVGV